jgi:hypothetical protein
MIVTRKNIINATLKINQMNSDEQQEIILKLLESNPTIVLRCLVTLPLFKVVLVNHGTDKISVIKAFREYMGASLAEAKDWIEGNPYRGLPSGVWAKDKFHSDAVLIMNKVNSLLSLCGVKAEILPNDATVKPLPATHWSVGY